jgi:hypothetical protein
MVLDDACKLAVLRARTKVIIFSSHWDDPPRRVPDILLKLRACHGDTDPWLWLDVPSDRQPVARTPRAIRYGVIQGCARVPMEIAFPVGLPEASSGRIVSE